MKLYGKIGYENTTETSPGVWKSDFIEHSYPMDVYSLSRNLQGSAKVNDDISMAMVVSILADPFAYQNYQAIRYVEYLNSKWKVASVVIEYPRLKLTLGGEFHVSEIRTIKSTRDSV